jgi:curved DNA-binding protein CbpA
MIKDPNHVSDTPYDILKLHPNAGPQEVKQALPNFLKDRRNAARIGEAQKARQRILDPKGRAEIDLLYYPVEPPLPSGAAPEPLKVDDLATPRCAEPGDLFTDVDSTIEAEPPSIEFAAMKIVDIPRYAEPGEFHPRPEIDR